jgi:hypothetical protein
MTRKSIVLSCQVKESQTFNRRYFVASRHAFSLGIGSERIKRKKSRLLYQPGLYSILTESGLSLKGCSPAEPFYVSPDETKIIAFRQMRK